ncbi:Integrator complex subunit 9-like protein [Cryptosporidium felis]|nr:Integrator complex subunit 9-like protein [Cryptosporidium felis]
MEVFFSPNNINDEYNESGTPFRSYQNFAFIKFYDVNILCDCPLICKGDLNFNSNKQLFEDLNLDNVHDDTLFPATFLFNESNELNNEKIKIDIILISNPNGLIGVPFLLHYNNYCRNKMNGSNQTEDEILMNTEMDNSSSNDDENYITSSDYDDSEDYCEDNTRIETDVEVKMHNDSGIDIDIDIDIDIESDPDSDDTNSDMASEDETKNKYSNIYEWLDKHFSKFDISDSMLLVTPPVYLSGIISLQQIIEYYSADIFNNIIDPFIWLKTSDLFNLVSSSVADSDKLIGLNIDKESLKTRFNIFGRLSESSSEYYYRKSKSGGNGLKTRTRKYESNDFNCSRGSTTGFGAAVNAASHIFDGNITQNIPATIGCNTSNSNTSHPPLFGKATGEEMSYYPRQLIENKLSSSPFNNCSHNFEIKLIHIGEVVHFNKNYSKFKIHSFDSGYCLGGVGYHISTNNMDFDVNKAHENLTIIGPISLELERYPAPLYLGDLLSTNNLVFYGNFLSHLKKKVNEDKPSSSIDEHNTPTNSETLPIINLKKAENKINSDIPEDSILEVNEKVAINYQTQLNVMVRYISETLINNGSILIPIDCSGLLCLEIVEFIGQKISELSMPIQAPIYLVGGGFPTLILNADISSEWTAPSRTRRVMLPNPNPPFLFSFLKKSNRLYVFHTTEELSTVYREPAIFLVTNSNLKFGPSKDLFNALNRPNNRLLIVDPAVNFDHLIKNLGDKALINIIHYPIYYEPNIYDLINTITPYYNQNKHKFNLILPKNDLLFSNINSLKDSIEFVKFKNIKLIPTNSNKIIFNGQNNIFNCSKDWIPIILSLDIVNNTKVKRVDPNLFVGKNESIFDLFDGQLILDFPDENETKQNDQNTTSEDELKEVELTSNIEKSAEKEDEQLNKSILFGSTTIKSFINELKNRNINDFSINYNDFFRSEKNVISISIPSLKSKIFVFSSNNFIVNSNIHESREIIYDIIASLLTSV